MAVYRIPDEYNTLHEAVDAAAVSDDRRNTIEIHESPIVTSSVVELPVAFNADRQLTIRPSPRLRRAIITNNDHSSSGQSIFAAAGTGYVTFQDLDIVRNITNRHHLVELSGCHSITIERCRIGSIFQGSPGWSNLHIARPTDVIVRNSIFFAYSPSTFDHGIWAELATAMGNSLLLYNNVVADYKEQGIHVTGAGDDAFLLLRNNVVANHPSVNPEPFAYDSEVLVDVAVETSYNAAFASVERVEHVGGGCQSVSGEAGADFLRRAQAQIDGSFVQHTWVVDPAWDPNTNVDFFRLVRGGPLHSEPADAGTNVRMGAPHERDVAVTDDIEGDVRPAGIPLHTDRGPDQIREDDTFLDLGFTPPIG